MTAGRPGGRFGEIAQVRSPFKPAHSQRQGKKVGPASRITSHLKTIKDLNLPAWAPHNYLKLLWCIGRTRTGTGFRPGDFECSQAP